MGASSLRISRLVQRVEEQRSEQATGAAEGKLLRDLATALRELCEELTEGVDVDDVQEQCLAAQRSKQAAVQALRAQQLELRSARADVDKLRKEAAVAARSHDEDSCREAREQTLQIRKAEGQGAQALETGHGAVQAQLRDITAQLQAALAQAAQLTQQLRSAEEGRGELTSQLEAAWASSSAAEERLADVQDQLGGAQRQQASLAADLDALRAERDELTARVAAQQEQAGLLQRQARERSGELETRHACLAGELERARADAAASRELASSAEQRSAALYAQLADAQAAEAAATQRLDAAKVEGAASEQQLRAALEDSRGLRDELQKRDTQHALAAQQLADALAASAAAREEASVAAARSAAAHADSEATQRRLADVTSQARSAEAECARLRVRLEALQAQAQAASETAEASLQEAHELRKAAAMWKDRYCSERACRRQLHESLQTLRGNIRVVCRVRPPRNGVNVTALDADQPGSMTVTHPDKDRRSRHFEFNDVLGARSSQADVFEAVAPLIRSCEDGYNAAIIAYGQTGSGKTFTMSGDAEQPGLQPRALELLFASLAASGDDAVIEVSAMEVYCEQVRDLLAAPSKPSSPCPSPPTSLNGSLPSPPQPKMSLDINGLGAGQLPASQERVPGLTWVRTATCVDAQAVLERARARRATDATCSNATSSRSHELVTIRIRSDSNNASAVRRLTLVDLAGSERIAKSKAEGQSLVEAQAINKSLSSLGDVVAALQSHSGHVPYRNSRLTQILQDSLSGGSKVLLVCNVSPDAADVSETLSSLGFAQRAGQVEGTPAPCAVRAHVNGRASVAPSNSLRVTSGRRTPSSAVARRRTLDSDAISSFI